MEWSNQIRLAWQLEVKAFSSSESLLDCTRMGKTGMKGSNARNPCHPFRPCPLRLGYSGTGKCPKVKLITQTGGRASKSESDRLQRSQSALRCSQSWSVVDGLAKSVGYSNCNPWLILLSRDACSEFVIRVRNRILRENAGKYRYAIGGTADTGRGLANWRAVSDASRPRSYPDYQHRCLAPHTASEP